MDGYITIGTELSTDKFDKQITDLEKKMQKEEDKKVVIGTKLSGQERELDTQRKKVDELADAYQRLKELQDVVSQGKATPSQFLEMQGLTNQFGSLENLGNQFDRALTSQDRLEQKVASTKYQYDAISQKVSDFQAKINSINLQKQTREVEKLRNGFSSVGNSLQSAVKKAGRLALAVFGIRSAYLALRRASSDLANYDQQYATNLEYIRYVLTQAIAPVLRAIVQLTATVLRYIGMIVQALFGVNIFASGSAENFQKMKAGASGTSKAVKEIKKQLAGFDEMNVLTDQSDTGTAGGGGGASIPDFDLSDMEGETPEWMKWIADNRGLVIGGLLGIASALTLLRLGLSPLKSLGIGLIIWGIVDAIISLKEYLNDGTWENFGKTIEGIGIAIIGLGIMIGSVPVAVAGAAVLIFGIITKYWDKIKAFFQKGIDWLRDKSDWIHEHFGDIIGNIYDYFVDRFQAILDFVNTVFTSIRQIFDGIIQFLKGVFTGSWEDVWEGLRKIVSGVFNAILGVFNYIIDVIKAKLVLWGKTAGDIFGGAFKGIVNAVLRTIENVLNVPIRAINGLIDKVNSIPRSKYYKIKYI